MSNITCARSGCSNTIALSDDQESRLRQTHQDFYCLLGHSNYFPGKTDATRVTELEIALQDARKRSEEAVRWRENIISSQSYSIRTLKGHITRLKSGKA